MKVLFFAPYIYDVNHKEFSISSSGFGYMVNDILQEISGHCETYLITHKISGGYSDKYESVRHTKKDIISSLHPRDIIRATEQVFINRDSFKYRMRYVYYYLNTGCVRKAINQIHPDIIHIHGLTMQTKPVIELCEELGCNYLVTVHGLNGSSIVNASKKNKEYERNGLLFLEEHNRIVTTVSTGTRNHIIEDYGLSGENIRVIINGIRLPENTERDTREGKKYILCVGSISTRKNQMQLIRACSLMTEEEKRQVEVHIVGAPSAEIDIDGEIDKLGLQETITFHGFVQREQISEMWKLADLNVVVSRSEGFGLSIIEGYSFGVPCIAFDDIDAVLDVYDTESMELIHSKNDEGVLQAIRHALNRQWDRACIIENAKKYSLSQLCLRYMDAYKDALGRNENARKLR